MFESFYRSLYLIRRVEEEVARIYPTDKIKSPVHLSIGQESIAVGVCQALRENDVVFGTYRCHALYLAKGGSLKAMIAELYGKATGSTGGKGGSMHLIAKKDGFMGASAVVATTIPHAVGYAMAQKLKQSGVVVVSVFGDGAVEEGVFHESLNFAVLKKIPMIFICENNHYAIHSRLEARQPARTISDRARAFGLPVECIDDGNVTGIYNSIHRAAKNIREHGTGPYFFELFTYRWKEHVGPNDDWQAGYRDAAEAESWLRDDQVKVIGEKLDPAIRWEIEQDVEEEIETAFRFAEESPFPTDDALYTDNFRES